MLGDHSESIRIEYDPKRVSYETLLEIFWKNHSPGESSYSRQYAAFIFYHDEKQRKAAMDSRNRVAMRSKGPIYTEIVPASTFYPAEAYHQDFLTLNPSYPYIVYNDLPKVENLKRLFPAAWRDKPVLVSAAGG